MTYLIPVYPPGGTGRDTITTPSGEVVNAIPISTYIVGFRGATRLITGQVQVTALRSLLVGSDDFRRTITIQNVGANDVYIGGDNVSILNGYKIAANKALTLEISAPIYAITASTSETVQFLIEADK